jgi:DNA-binding response OmpR family regulator
MSNILIIDDDPSILDLFRVSLSPYFRLDFINHLNDAESIILNNYHDLIILDLHFEDQVSFFLLKNIKIKRPQLLDKILIMTSDKNIDCQITAHQLGVRDFLKKPLHLKLLKVVIEKHLFSISTTFNRSITVGPFCINFDQQRIIIENNPVELTPKEFNILKTLIERKNLLVTRNQLMEQVWDISNDSLARTIDMHISSIRKKIGKYSSWIKTKRGFGYMLSIDNSSSS